MKRLFYDKKVSDFTKQLSLLALRMEMELDNLYLNYYNDTCPSCLGKFKLSHDRTIKGIGGFWAAVLTDEYNKLIPYVICKNCSSPPSRDKSNQIEDYIIDVLQLDKEKPIIGEMLP